MHPPAGFLARGSPHRRPPSRPRGQWHDGRDARRTQLRGQPRLGTPY
ncbi:hypothetical protein [Azospirillum endophyticum]